MSEQQYYATRRLVELVDLRRFRPYLERIEKESSRVSEPHGILKRCDNLTPEDAGPPHEEIWEEMAELGLIQVHVRYEWQNSEQCPDMMQIALQEARSGKRNTPVLLTNEGRRRLREARKDKARGAPDKRKRGRPTDTDAAQDAEIARAWAVGRERHPKHEDLARELGMTTKSVKRALDRNRKRRKK